MIITSITSTSDSFSTVATPVIDYTSDTIDEYMVVVNLPEDWEVVHNYIINENEIDGIPNRKVNCSNLQEFSLRTAIYEMSSAEAEILKTHSKVENVELNPDKYPQPQSSFADRFGNVVAFPKPQLRTAFSGYTPSTSTTNGVRANWSQLFLDDPSSEPYQGNSITSTDTVDRDISYTVTGSNVDAVIIDDGIGLLHPEFIASDGTYRVRDVILDGPYKADPAAFSGYTTTVTIDGVNIGTRAQEARARQWWSDTSIRSSAFQSLGTLTIPSTYTRIHAHSKNGTNAITGGHGTACASEIGGKHHGLAFECNLWNIRIRFALPGGGFDGIISGSTALNACTIFHNAKKAASSDPDPTVINNSWGAFSQTGNDYDEDYYHTYRGNNQSYTGTGYEDEGNGTNHTNIVPSNSGSCRQLTMITLKLASTAYVSRYSSAEIIGGGYLNAAVTSTDTAAQNAISAGCIVLAAVGNDNQKLSDKNDADFNNKYYGTDSSYSGGSFLNRVGGVQKGFSGDHDAGKGTIRVGGVDCAVEPTDEKQGVTKYTIRKVSYSNNGPMIDIFAPAEATMAAAYASYESKFDAVARVDDSNYKDRAFNGTSSACPNATALVAIYLQSNRGSSHSAIRTWLTGTACKTNLLSDPYSNINSAYYWSSNYNGSTDLPGNSFETYNIRGNGNLRGAPNRVLFNPLTTDTTAPTLSSSVPADGATGVAINANLVLNFSETVIAQSGKNIVIKKSSDDSVVETISVTSGQVTGSNSSQITVNPSSNLDTSTSYYVLIDSASFKDAAGNSYAGISDKTSLNFTTVSSDTTAPTLVSTNPSTGATGVAIFSDVEFNFSEAVFAQSGNIVIKKASDNSVVETTSVTSVDVTGSGTNQIRLNPDIFAENTTFYILIDATAFDDAAGNSFAGVSDSTTIRFTTGSSSLDGEYSVRFFGNGLSLNGQLVIT